MYVLMYVFRNRRAFKNSEEEQENGKETQEGL